jgi:serine/threonine protein kinase/tetratricopeptide (TPR) repeat protein
MSDSSSDREPLEELAESFLARYRAGERPSLTEFAAAHPDLADQIRELFPALVEMEQAGSAVGSEPEPDVPGARSRGALLATLGDFRIIREVGRGGMGVVYEAVQESLSRHVALKVFAPWTRADPKLMERFQREAKTAARLHHTNIVPVFGVGEHGGHRYYAMQFIQGQGLDAILQELRRLRSSPQADGAGPAPLEPPEWAPLAATVAHGLLTGQFGHRATQAGSDGTPADSPAAGFELADASRAPASAEPSSDASHWASQPGASYARTIARVGLQVAEALAHAHSQGVLHRDIKPSNLLLDVEGNVWVTDFGLAKSDDADALTDAGDIVGTIRYMAPERFRGDSGPGSDVYGLGVTLYELLTLRPAFDEGDRACLIDHILHTDPPPPRTVDAKIPRDLETIVLKAMARDPADRYASAGALAEDMRRFLEDRTILARRSSVTERVWRWCKRNPLVAGLAAAVFLVMAAGTAASAWQATRARTAEAAALKSAAAEKTQRAAAEEQEAETRAVLEFVEKKIFAAARPERQEGGLGREVSLRKALESSLPHIAASFGNQPLIEARLRGTLGTSFRYLADFAIAKEQFEVARSLFTKHRGTDHPDTLRTMNNLANCYDDLGRPTEALKLREETLALQKLKLGPDHPDTLKSMNNLAISYSALGRHADALELREEALALRKVKLGPDHPDTLSSMHNLAVGYDDLGRPAEALKLLEETLALRKLKLGPDHPDTLRTMNNLANSYNDLGRHADALKLREEALALRKLKLGPDHRDTLWSMHNLAVSYDDLGRHADALKLREETLALRKLKLGPDHPDTLLSQMNVASGLINAGRAPEGAVLARQATELWERRKGTDAFSLYTAARFRAISAAVLRAMPKSPEAAKGADQEADRAVAWLNKAVAAGSIDAAGIQGDHYLDALHDRADFQALVVSQLAKAIKSHPKLATAWSDRGAAYARLRQWRNAIDDCSEAIKLDSKLTRAWIVRGEAYLGEGDWEKAAADYGQVMMLDPNDDWYWYPTAALRLRIGDTEGYRRICRDVLARFGSRAQLAERISKTCLLVPEAVSDLGPVFDLADRAVTGTEQQQHRYYRWFVQAKCLAEYRAGRDSSAVAWLTRFSPKADGMHVDAAAFSILAMAQHRLGRAEATREALGHARAILTEKMPDPRAGRPFTADFPFRAIDAHDWLHAAILFREAEAVVAADQKTNQNHTRKGAGSS